MRIQGGLNQPFQGKKQEAKSDIPFFVIVGASVDQAIANPGVFQDIKTEFLNNQFDELDFAKDEIITRVNQFRDSDSGYLPSFYIWKALSGKFSSYIKNSNFLNNDPSPIQSMGIQDQWRFEPQTNGFLSEPYQAQTDGISDAETGAGNEAIDQAIQNQPAKPRAESAMQNWIKVQQTIKPADVPDDIAIDEEVNTTESDTAPSTDTPKIQTANPIEITEPITSSSPDHPLMAYFKCPVSKTPLTNPYISPTGETYNYDALAEQLNKTGKNPRTGDPLSLDHCIPNNTVRDLLVNFKDVSSGRSKLLLCPYSRLPFKTPVLINPFTQVGAALLSVPKKEGDDATLFEQGRSYSRDAILNQQKRVRSVLPDARLTPADLIPNTCLTKFLKALASARR